MSLCGSLQGQRSSSLNEGWSPALTNPARCSWDLPMSWCECSEDEGGDCLGMLVRKQRLQSWMAPASLGWSPNSLISPEATLPHHLYSITPNCQSSTTMAVAASNTISVFEIQILCYILNNTVSHESRARQTWLQTPALKSLAEASGFTPLSLSSCICQMEVSATPASQVALESEIMHRRGAQCRRRSQ